MSLRKAKRWGRLFVFAWVCMWISAALLPCCEVEAAVAAQAQAATDCGHGTGHAPESNDRKTGTCLDIAAPAPSSAETLASPAGDAFAQQMAGMSAPLQIALPPQVHAPPRISSTAPSSLAPHLRTTRLLI